MNRSGRIMLRLATLLSTIAGLTGVLVLLGYVLHVRALVVVWPGLQGMSPVTAIGLFVLAAAIILERSGRELFSRRASLVAIAIGVAVTMGYAGTGSDAISIFVSDRLFRFDEPGRTSPATALCLIVIGAAGLLRCRPARADATATIALIVSFLALLGYAYGVQDLYALPAFQTMAVHTAAALFVLAVASLIVRPQNGWAAVIAAGEAGGQPTRRQLAFTLIPPIAGWILLRGTHADKLGPAAAMALLVILTVLPLALLILRDGRMLNVLDAERRSKATLQAAISQTLEARLAEQAAQLQHEAALERERESALRDSIDFTRLALSAVGGVGVWTYEVASDRFFCDAAIAELYGLDLAQAAAGILREGFLANIHPDDRSSLKVTMESGLRHSGDLELEYRILHPDASVRWVLSRGHTYHDDAGKPVRRTGIGIDITKQRQLEEQLRQSQKMEAVGQLTGGVAHDFNNLLTVIRSSVDLLLRPTLSEERRRRYIEAISDATTRAAKLTGQLLAFARRQTLKPEIFDVVNSVEAISDMVVTLTGSRVQIKTQVPDDPHLINADPNQFDTALVNLAVNARDAMNGEGHLIIAVKVTDHVPAMRGHPAVRGEFVAVKISDTGSGIAPAALERIFEPFFTTKAVGQGTGLGLSQVFGFVKQSGGEVAVDSIEGQGTTFTLYLPRVRNSVDEVRTEPSAMPLVDGHGTCVLLVEDNTEVGAFATQSLQELGYRSILAKDAAAALAELAADAARFDVVFSDVVMPGMSGVELGHEIRRRHVGLPVVLTSGYSHAMAQNGTDGFELLTKPYSIEQLSRILTKAAHWRQLNRMQTG